MGGTTFLVTATGATIGDAYRDDARNSCGHGGYTGTIA